MLVLAGSVIQAYAQTGGVQQVSFQGNVVPGNPWTPPIRLIAKLHEPAARATPWPVVVISPSSGGVRREREMFYAEKLAAAGIAALIVDSYASRGLTNSVHDQSLLIPWQAENDAVGALRWLAADPRFRRDRIGVTGVSKGGAVALWTALEIRRQWTRVAPLAFAAHIPIAPPCHWNNRAKGTSGAPIFFMLAELDDQTPAPQCVEYARQLTAAGNRKIEVKVYENAHHAWENIGQIPYFDPRAENYARCIATIEDDGSSTAANGFKLPRDKEIEWAKRTCMTLGTNCCGGTEELRQRAAGDMVAFLKRHGF